MPYLVAVIIRHNLVGGAAVELLGIADTAVGVFGVAGVNVVGFRGHGAFQVTRLTRGR